MKEEDKKTLAESIGVLLPLSTKKVILESKVFNQQEIAKLSMEILEYSSRFKNTGCIRIESFPFF
ncbi:hypothetical protein CMI40_00470 [Candidatus Pacearchaeota archaeon]|jgi:hypothetical protein|nr:hypothetical protein [Candidatus Pacearchaeota archaeon]|tara:strand:- start:15227 stop:15421 length:195 start_codon:yes stop_codon:yes gene_type:complete